MNIARGHSLRYTMVAVVILSMLCGTALSTPRPGSGFARAHAQQAVPFTVTLSLEDIYFEPDVLEIPANQNVRLRIENFGAAPHSFVVPDLGIDVEVLPGRSGEITINAPVGEYPFLCAVTGHKDAGMVGTLRVGSSGEQKPEDTPSPAAIGEWNFAGLSAEDLLPEARDLEGDWTVDGEGARTAAEVARPFGSSGQALLDRWGWEESVYRDFTRQNSEQFENDVTALSVSIHAFDTSAGAVAAFEPFSGNDAKAYGLVDRPVDDLGDNVRLFSGQKDGSNLSILYVQAGDVLIRVSASSASGDPGSMPGAVAEIVLAKGAQSPGARAAATVSAVGLPVVEGRTPSPQATAAATVSPVSSPAAALGNPSCEGLPGYSRQVLAIETAAWNQLVAEFGIDDESDLLLLEEEQFANLATILDSEATLLMQIEPPAFAERWHEAKIASAQLSATAARMAPMVGSPFASIVMLWDVSEFVDDQESRAYMETVEACPAFEALWSELDLIDGEAGDPPGTEPDYSVCTGLEQFGSDIGHAFARALANRPDLAEVFFESSDMSEDDLLTLSPTELLMLAAAFREIGGELAKISAPDYALEWHLMQFMSYGAFADYFEAAAAYGFEAADAEFGMGVGLSGLLMEGAAEKATEECSVFAEFAAS